MAITYDRNTKQWTFEKEALRQQKPVSYPGSRYINVKYEKARVDRNRYELRNIEASISTSAGPNTERTETTNKTRWGDVTKQYVYKSFEIPLESSGTNYGDRLRGHLENNLGKKVAYSDAVQGAANGFIREQPQIERDVNTARTNEKINNEIINPYNQRAQKLNAEIPKAQAIVTATKGGDYLQQRKALEKLGISGLTDQFKNFYVNEKVENWDSKLGAKPPYGTFDATYYSKQNPKAKAAYDQAVKDDDVDIVNRYGSTNYYLWHYTTQGKAAGARGNEAEKTAKANAYKEVKPTDKEIQQIREKQLNVSSGEGGKTIASTINQKILAIPEVKTAWDKAKAGDSYWKTLAKQNYLDVEDGDQFATLFRLSPRESDKQVVFNNNVNVKAGNRITDLEDTLITAAGTERQKEIKQFGALVQNSLKESVAELKKANAKNEQLSLLRGFGGVGEILDINKTLSDSLLGDTGIGGILSYGGSTKRIGTELEEKFAGITGVRNNVEYNWQNWFDTALAKEYEKDIELGYTTGEAEKKITIDKEFANKYIQDYLKPRFNTSRSMDEFIEYMDIRQEEQTPFTTQDVYTGLKNIADARANKYLDDVQKTADRYFDADFYFNPTGNIARSSDYTAQAKNVADDWKLAKQQAQQKDGYWYQQAYRFGVDVTNKEQFAKMHYEVKGRVNNYDPVKDIYNAGTVQSYITNNIAPALSEYVEKNPSVFSKFVLPEEFADEMLKGLDPSDSKAVQKVLDKLGIKDFTGDMEELRNYIVETFRTGSAQEIRENIKYLNEEGTKPSQSRLGVSYIVRPEDYKNIGKDAETELYKTFKNAGYGGTEDDFYKTFFPDVDRKEQAAITKLAGGKGVQLGGLDMSDPFEAFGSLTELLGGDDDDDDDDEKASTKTSNYFKLGLDDDEEPTTTKGVASSLLGEFTSLLKGF